MRKWVRRILIAIGILILFIVGGLIYKNIYINSQEKSNETIVKKNVKIITSETDKDERPNKVLEDKLEFKKDLKYKKGDVIVSGITSEADAGYIRKVVNTKKKNGKYIVQTEPAYLTDVFEKAHIVKQIELTENGVEEVDYKLNNMELYQDQDNPIEEKVVLVNDRGVTVTYWDCSRTLGGYSRSVVKAEISKVGDSEFVPGFPAGTNTDYSSLGSFMVAKVHLVGEMDSKLDSDYNATDSEFFAVVPASYEGEREFQGQAGFVDEFSFEYPTPYAFIAEAPDGQFTPEEEKEVIEILKSFKIAE